MPRHPVMTVEERFWIKVVRSETCWTWTASKDGGGYGQFWIKGASRPWKASRVSYLLTYGDIPAGMFVCHHCDNRLCVRPEHLFLGTHADNMRDMAAKKRGNNGGVAGEKNPNAKLTLADVEEIRRLYAAGARQVDLAARYGVGQTAISKIVRKEKWQRIIAVEGY